LPHPLSAAPQWWHRVRQVDLCNLWQCSIVLPRSVLPRHKCGFWLHWLTYQARYVRVSLLRRAMHAFCESPWYLSAKHHVLGACFSLMAPFRTRFSPCEVARTAYVQRLIGCLYILWYCYIPPCRCTAQYDLRTGPGSLSVMISGLDGSSSLNCMRGIVVRGTVYGVPRLCFLPPHSSRVYRFYDGALEGWLPIARVYRRVVHGLSGYSGSPITGLP
jgi:hypothetical protein